MLPWHWFASCSLFWEVGYIKPDGGLTAVILCAEFRRNPDGNRVMVITSAYNNREHPPPKASKMRLRGIPKLGLGFGLSITAPLAGGARS